VILPPSHRLATRKTIDLKELARDPFVIYSSVQAPALHAVVTLACQRAGFVPRVAQEAHNCRPSRAWSTAVLASG
jgi:DNA-binding transcriptional LysR family regulator